MVEVEKGLYRVTFSLPLGIDHVHCYFVRSSKGGFILVDTGLGSRDPEKRWRPVLDRLDGPVEAIVVTVPHGRDRIRRRQGHGTRTSNLPGCDAAPASSSSH